MAYNQTDPNTQPPQGRMSGFPEMKEVGMNIYNIGSLSNGDGIENGKKAVGLQQQQVYFKLNTAHKACARN